MEDQNKSILDQILDNRQIEEAANLDAVEIINNLFNRLGQKENDILARRFGLRGMEKETLEKIGKMHKLTRERIRQIETAGIKRLKMLKDFDTHLSGLKSVMTNLLEEHGGLMEKEYLFNNLINFSSGGMKDKENAAKHKTHFDFLISKLLHEEFETFADSEYFKECVKLKYKSLEHLEFLAKELLEKIHEMKKIFMTEEIIGLSKELEFYKNNHEKFNSARNLDISGILINDLFKENSDVINENKVIYSIMRAAKKIEQNKFGFWGISDWREIKPKTINDKIYLVLKNAGKPMHFADVSEMINKINFDGKKANAATAHNELILGEKYILVGRGLYGLKEWGYQKGVVADVILKIMSESGMPMSREEIVNKVLEQRIVKKTTINLSLMNRDKFEIIADGKYKLKS